MPAPATARSRSRGPSPRLPSGAQPAQADRAPFLRRPGPVVVRAGLIAVNLAAVTFFVLSYSPHGVGLGRYHIDLDVYRIGGRVWLRHGNLYGPLPATRAGVRLPFTYPPVAAILLDPLALVPFPVAADALTFVTIALLALVLRLFLRRAAEPAARSAWALAWLLPLALFLEPVRDTLAFGQINVVLMALVSLDCLAETPRWPRGALTGLAAAVKLTPAAFVLFFVLRGDYRAAVRASLAFAGLTAVGFAAAWPDSVRFWTRAVFQPSRAGNLATASNQCIQGVLARAGLSPHSLGGVATWLALSAVVVIVARRGMRHAFAASLDWLALALNAFAALLISPISWSHHWVWCEPALLTVAVLARRHRSRLALAAACAGLLVFAAAPQFWFRHGLPPGITWAVLVQADRSAYVLFAVVILLISAAGICTSALVPPLGDGTISTRMPCRAARCATANRPMCRGTAISAGGGSAS